MVEQRAVPAFKLVQLLIQRSVAPDEGIVDSAATA
jgi:hypothetical protein